MLAQNLSGDTIHIKTQLEKAIQTIIIKPDSTKQIADKCLKKSILLKYSYGEAEALYINSIFYTVKGQYDTALYLSNKAFSIYHKLKNNVGKYKILNSEGNLYLDKGEYDSALIKYNKTLELNKTLNDSSLLSKSYNNIGSAYMYLKDFTHALNYYLMSLKVKEAISNNAHDSLKLVSTLNNIGLIYIYQKDSSLALTYFNKALAISEKYKNPYTLAGCYNNIASLYSSYDKMQKAKDFYRKSFEIYQSIDNRLGITSAATNLCNTYTWLNDFYQAKKYCSIAYKNALAIHNTPGLIAILNTKAELNINIAEKANKSNFNDSAIIFATEAIRINKEQNDYLHSSNSHRILKTAYLNKSDYKQAFQHYKEENRFLDSVYTLEKQIEIKKIESDYFAQKKELEIKNLEKVNQIKSLLVKSMKFERVLLYIAISIFLITIAIMVYYRRKLKLKNKTILKQNKTINKQFVKIKIQNKELTFHKNNLEKLVAKRTKELEQAKIKAEESDRLKSSFLTNMSHELRTPLNAIQGFTDLLIEEDDYSLYPNYAKMISTNANSLLSLVLNIIELSRLESKEIELNNCEIDITNLLEELYSNHKLIFEHKNLSLEYKKIPLNESVLISDYDRLYQIFNQLIQNAYKYTETGGATFGVANISNDITFFIKDTGVGIKPESLNQIFEVFTKIEDNKEKLYRGTGIGLTLCKKTIKALNGEIWIESEVNKGTTVYFSVPLNADGQL
jgi:signal transduction histidine kinase